MKRIKEVLKSVLSKKYVDKLKKINVQVKTFRKTDDLTFLAKIYDTDKWGDHYYTPHYQFHFSSLRKKKLNIFEIGVGGYDRPNRGGASLRMWKKYFPNSMIYSIDIYDKSKIQEKKIKIFKGSQVDFSFMDVVLDEIGVIDILIDDGSHINEHVIETFKYMFPRISKTGIYVIEDTQTSYWENYGGNSKELELKSTIMGYFKSLIDGLNYDEIVEPDFDKDYFTKNIKSLHFYHNLIFIYKGNNEEGSNILVNNKIND